MKINLEKVIEDFLGGINIDVDILYYFDWDSIDWEDAGNKLYNVIDTDSGFEFEFSHYGTAMEYLSKNDYSLTNSLQIASDLGYEVDNLNSVILASIMVSQEMKEEFLKVEYKITDFFTDLLIELENEFDKEREKDNFEYKEDELQNWIFEVKLKCNQK